MALLGGELTYRALTRWVPAPPGLGSDYDSEFADACSVFGDDFLSRIEGCDVMDFGCGKGELAVEMARGGAKTVLGVDMQQRLIAQGGQLAARHGVSDHCRFALEADGQYDVITSKDAFEHFGDVPEILRIMARCLRPGGRVIAAFGPTWLHPYGGHLFSVFPWAHLLISERTLVRWRANYRKDGATGFGDVDGGLNRITIAQFERFVRDSPLAITEMEHVPIRGLDLFRHPLLREIGTSLVRCEMTLH